VKTSPSGTARGRAHLTSMHSTGNYYVSKLLPLIAEAQVHAISNPLINITLQGRHDTTDYWRARWRYNNSTAGVSARVRARLARRWSKVAKAVARALRVR